MLAGNQALSADFGVVSWQQHGLTHSCSGSLVQPAVLLPSPQYVSIQDNYWRPRRQHRLSPTHTLDAPCKDSHNGLDPSNRSEVETDHRFWF